MGAGEPHGLPGAQPLPRRIELRVVRRRGPQRRGAIQLARQPVGDIL